MKILSRLLNNCRESDRQIGIELGISGGAVRARIQKMQAKKIIEEFFIKVEPPVLVMVSCTLSYQVKILKKF